DDAQSVVAVDPKTPAALTGARRAARDENEPIPRAVVDVDQPTEVCSLRKPDRSDGRTGDLRVARPRVRGVLVRPTEITQLPAIAALNHCTEVEARHLADYRRVVPVVAAVVGDDARSRAHTGNVEQTRRRRTRTARRHAQPVYVVTGGVMNGAETAVAIAHGPDPHAATRTLGFGCRSHFIHVVATGISQQRDVPER